MTTDVLDVLQLVLSAALLAMIGERIYHLCYRTRLSASGLRWVEDKLADEAERSMLAEWCRLAAKTGVANLLSAALNHGSEEAVNEELADLTHDALRRLRVIRVGATLASTTGLLIAIVRIRGGFSQPSGLAALEAGLPERIAMSKALFSMAIGIATSAVCFYALSALTREARALLSQCSRFTARLHAAAAFPRVD